MLMSWAVETLFLCLKTILKEISIMGWVGGEGEGGEARVKGQG